VQLDRGQTQLFGDFGVLDFTGLLKRKAHDTFSHVRTGCDGASAAKGFELDIRNNAFVVNTNLELHNIAAAVGRGFRLAPQRQVGRPGDVHEGGERLTQGHLRGQYRRQYHLWVESPPKIVSYQIKVRNILENLGHTFLGFS